MLECINTYIQVAEQKGQIENDLPLGLNMESAYVYEDELVRIICTPCKSMVEVFRKLTNSIIINITDGKLMQFSSLDHIKLNDHVNKLTS